MNLNGLKGHSRRAAVAAALTAFVLAVILDVATRRAGSPALRLSGIGLSAVLVGLAMFIGMNSRDK